MVVSEVVDRIVRLSVEYRRGDVSLYELVKRSGYFEKHEEIAEKDLRAALLQQPEFCEAWIQFSEDKRTDRGWYITQGPDHRYLVGFYGEGRHQDLQAYSERASACASYIKREIDGIMDRMR